MPSKRQRPRRFQPRGLSDAIDGTGAPAGACAQLSNLIPLPNALGIIVARPAMVSKTAIPNWATATTAEKSFGDVTYGMAGSTAFPGQDAPFLYESEEGTFTTITGLAAGLLPISQPTTGEWTPPTIASIGSRTIFTHPGFPGGTTITPVNIVFTATLTNGQPTLTGPDYLYNLPATGLLIVDSNSAFAAGTTVSGTAPTTIYTTGTATQGTNTMTVANAAGIVAGMTAYFPGGQSIIETVSGTTLAFPNNFPQSFTAAQCTFNGTTVTASANAGSGGIANVTLLAPPPAIKFGWLDFSGFSTMIVANGIGRQNLLTGFFSLLGIQPGMTVTGPGIAAGTTVSSLIITNFTLFGQTALNSQVLQLGSYPVGGTPAPGQFVSGPNIPAGTFVISYNPANYQVTLSNSATATAIGQYFTASGTLLQLSQNVTTTNTQVGFTIAGGTITSALWGAGDLAINPIASTTPPVCVNQMAGRAYFGVNTSTTAGVQASDSGSAGIQTFASQTLTFGDSTPVTAMSELPLSTLTGGIAQALIVFQSDTNMQQITGDFSTNDIAVNQNSTVAGTLAPLTIASCPRGVFYMASDGLRLINLAATVSDPIGQGGYGLTLPMSNVVNPTRASASYNENVYRLTVTWQPPPNSAAVWGSAQRTDEFWLHLAEHGKPLHESFWSGPHTSTCTFAQPYPAASSFLVAPTSAPGYLYQSDVRPYAATSYTEFGAQLQCLLQTLLMPDNQTQNAVQVHQTTIWLGLQSGSEEILVTAVDDVGQQLDAAYIWIGPFSVPAQHPIPWHNPLVFRQMSLMVQARATAQFQLGSIAIREEMLDYQLPYPISPEFILNQSIPGGPDVLGP